MLTEQDWKYFKMKPSRMGRFTTVFWGMMHSFTAADLVVLSIVFPEYINIWENHNGKPANSKINMLDTSFLSVHEFPEMMPKRGSNLGEMLAIDLCEEVFDRPLEVLGDIMIMCWQYNDTEFGGWAKHSGMDLKELPRLEHILPKEWRIRAEHVCELYMAGDTSNRRRLEHLSDIFKPMRDYRDILGHHKVTAKNVARYLGISEERYHFD